MPAPAWVAFTGLLAPSYAGRLARVFLMLREVHAAIPLSRAAAVFFVHKMVSTFVPARLGETALPLLARRWAGADWAATIGVFAWWRLGNVAVVAPLPTTAHPAAASLAGDGAGALPLPALGGIGPFEAGAVLGLDALGIAPSLALAMAVLPSGALLASVALAGYAGLLLGVLREHERARPRV